MRAAIVPFDDNDATTLTPYRAARLSIAIRRAEIEVAIHGVKMAAAVSKDIQFDGGVTDVVTAAAQEEIGFLKTGMALANGSAAGLEVVANLAILQQTAINRRIARTWGR